MSAAHKGKSLSNITKEKIGISHTKNLIGEKFGRLTVVAYARKMVELLGIVFVIVETIK